MDNNTVRVEAILLTGKEAIAIPYLAFIGGLSIAGAIGYKAFKTYRKFEKFIKNHKES